MNEKSTKFDVYSNVNGLKLIKRNVTKDEVIKYLKTLSLSERSHIYLEPVKMDKNKEREEER